MSNKKMKGIVLAACVASSFALAVPAMAATDSNANVACHGVNSCKGMGACKTATNSCKGKNSCKGQGVMMVTAAECTKEGGKVE